LREYIDLAVLLNNSNSNNTHDNKKIAFINGELIVQQEQNAPKITSIETWTDAFIIYMNIYCSVHTEKFAQLLFTQLGWEEKDQHLVGSLMTRNFGSGCRWILWHRGKQLIQNCGLYTCMDIWAISLMLWARS
jgi:hypothetical protein